MYFKQHRKRSTKDICIHDSEISIFLLIFVERVSAETVGMTYVNRVMEIKFHLENYHVYVGRESTYMQCV